MCAMTGVEPAAGNSDEANETYRTSSVLGSDQTF
jgi:hypothetical protein